MMRRKAPLGYLAIQVALMSVALLSITSFESKQLLAKQADSKVYQSISNLTTGSRERVVYFYAKLAKFGYIIGRQVGQQDVAAFLDVRYAAPPTGLLRFMPPAAVELSDYSNGETINASILLANGATEINVAAKDNTKLGARCLPTTTINYNMLPRRYLSTNFAEKRQESGAGQSAASQNKIKRKATYSEDCLNLNLFVPRASLSKQNIKQQTSKDFCDDEKWPISSKKIAANDFRLSSTISTPSDEHSSSRTGIIKALPLLFNPLLDGNALPVVVIARGMRVKDRQRNASLADDKNEENQRKWPHNHNGDKNNTNADNYDEDDDDETNLIEFANLAVKLNSIIVTFNYRIGIYGFLQVHDSKLGSRANHAILDNINLLHWIRKHISSFNGNSSDVSLIGVGEFGSFIVQLLTESSLSKGMFKSVKLIDDGQYDDDKSNINLKFVDLIDFGIEQHKFQFTNKRHILDNNKWHQIYEKLESFKTKQQQTNISMNPSDSLFQVLKLASIEDLDFIQNELISIYKQGNNNNNYTRDQLSLLAKAALMPTLKDQILFPNIASIITNSHQLNFIDIESRLEPIMSKYEVSYAEYIKRLRADPSDDPLSVAQTDLQASDDETSDKYQTHTKPYNIQTNKQQHQVLVSTNSNVGKISRQAAAKFFLLSNLYCLRELLLANRANSSSSSWPYVNQRSIERNSKLANQIDDVIRYSDMERMRSYHFKVSISVDFEDNSQENLVSRNEDNKQPVSYSIDSNQQAFDRYPEISNYLRHSILASTNSKQTQYLILKLAAKIDWLKFVEAHRIANYDFDERQEFSGLQKTNINSIVELYHSEQSNSHHSDLSRLKSKSGNDNEYSIHKLKAALLLDNKIALDFGKEFDYLNIDSSSSSSTSSSTLLNSSAKIKLDTKAINNFLLVELNILPFLALASDFASSQSMQLQIGSILAEIPVCLSKLEQEFANSRDNLTCISQLIFNLRSQLHDSLANELEFVFAKLSYLSKKRQASSSLASSLSQNQDANGSQELSSIKPKFQSSDHQLLSNNKQSSQALNPSVGFKITNMFKRALNEAAIIVGVGMFILAANVIVVVAVFLRSRQRRNSRVSLSIPNETFQHLEIPETPEIQTISNNIWPTIVADTTTTSNHITTAHMMFSNDCEDEMDDKLNTISIDNDTINLNNSFNQQQQLLFISPESFHGIMSCDQTALQQVSPANICQQQQQYQQTLPYQQSTDHQHHHHHNQTNETTILGPQGTLYATCNSTPSTIIYTFMDSPHCDSEL